MDWRGVRGYEGIYVVSESGIIKSVKRDKPIGFWLNHCGYPTVKLSKPRQQYLVHRIVADAFLENPNNLPVVNHIDSDRTNSHYRNLEWCDQRYNLHHANRLGRMKWDNRKGFKNAVASN